MFSHVYNELLCFVVRVSIETVRFSLAVKVWSSSAGHSRPGVIWIVNAAFCRLRKNQRRWAVKLESFFVIALVKLTFVLWICYENAIAFAFADFLCSWTWGDIFFQSFFLKEWTSNDWLLKKVFISFTFCFDFNLTHLFQETKKLETTKPDESCCFVLENLVNYWKTLNNEQINFVDFIFGWLVCTCLHNQVIQIVSFFVT